MPQIKTIDEIMTRERRNMLFVQFNPFLDDNDPGQWRSKHFAWFDQHNLRYEEAAPRGWLPEDTGVFAVYFDSPSDPRLAAYSAAFEDADGKSLHQDAYQMMITHYPASQTGP